MQLVALSLQSSQINGQKQRQAQSSLPSRLPWQLKGLDWGDVLKDPLHKNERIPCLG
jgi:hypothetical protein